MEIMQRIDADGYFCYSESNDKQLAEFRLKNVGKEIVTKYESIKDIKSYEQLKFYFGVIIPAFVDHTGDTNKAMFDAYFRDKYLSSIHEINGEMFTYIPTLQIGKNKVSKEKMSQFIEDCLNELVDIGGGIEQRLVDEYRHA